MSGFNKMLPDSAGIDIGSEKIFIAVEEKEVKQFGTFTDDYLKAIEYLKENNISSVAMEATGIYWISLYDMIEASGIKVCLVNARDVKQLPGRKSDVADCQWIQQLYSHGLLRNSFIPDEMIRQLRSYMRLREDHIEMASTHILHMQKSLELMNVKIHNVISQIHGASGMRIIRAIVTGVTDAEELSKLCEEKILREKKEKVLASLKGNYKEEYVFALSQAIDAYDFYQNQILQCDEKIEELLKLMNANKATPGNITKEKKQRHNPININNLHEELMKLTDGKDPSRITGLTDKTILKVISETGIDYSIWPTKKHYTSWLGLSPSKHQSGKSNKKRKWKKNTKAGQIFKEAAASIAASKHSAFTGFYQRIKAKKGGQIATKATARKLAERFYDVITLGTEYVEEGLERYLLRFREQRIKKIRKQANQLGLELIPTA
jgi:transposase